MVALWGFVGVVVLIAVGNGGGIRTCGATEAVDHVAGGDEGLAAAAAAAAERTFRVGDSIWLADLAAEGSIAEVGSREEFDACDLSNPIRTYTGGAHRVNLDAAGPRYFAGGGPGGCVGGGLKLHVHVLPREEAEDRTATTAVAAQGADIWPPPPNPFLPSPPPPKPFWPSPPPPPSASARLEASPVVMWTGLVLLCLMISFHGV